MVHQGKGEDQGLGLGGGLMEKKEILLCCRIAQCSPILVTRVSNERREINKLGSCSAGGKMNLLMR